RPARLTRHQRIPPQPFGDTIGTSFYTSNTQDSLMAKNFEVQGTIHSIDETRSYGANGFTKRDFVIKLTGEADKPEYPNYVALEWMTAKCALLDNCLIGDEI